MPRSGLATTTVAPAMAAPEGSFTVPVIEPVVWAKAAAQNIRTSNVTNRARENFMVNVPPMGAGIYPRWFSRLCGATEPRGSVRVFEADFPFGVETPRTGY